MLRNPTDVNGTGGAASYRVEYRLEPVIPGRPLAHRKWRYARSLEKAYVVATEIAEEMRERAAGTFVEYHTDVCIVDVVTRWLDAPHPRWGEQYPDKVRSLLKNWVLPGDITVNWPSRSTGTPVAKVPIGALTADHYNQASSMSAPRAGEPRPLRRRHSAASRDGLGTRPSRPHARRGGNSVGIGVWTRTSGAQDSVERNRAARPAASWTVVVRTRGRPSIMTMKGGSP